jgi:hypothetical protein
VDWSRFRRHWPWTLCTTAVLVLQLGSRGDRIVVVTIWLALAFLPVEQWIRRLAAARDTLPRYALLAAIALVWIWSNSRFRLGGGPFHIVDADLYRGYPFMFQD